MRHSSLFPLLTLLATPTFAVDSTCEIYLTAAEKSAQQPARHTVTEPGDGSSLEAIILDGQFFAKLEGKWMKLPGSPGLQGERKLVASIRSGKYPMTGCRKLDSDRIDGMPTTVISYVLELPGNPAEETRAYIGADGLVHQQTSGKTRVRHRYTGVRAPM
ncbi:MAG TPA: hypothetical protein VIV63_06390 [Steroidobacteraceae bacterium]